MFEKLHEEITKLREDHESSNERIATLETLIETKAQDE